MVDAVQERPRMVFESASVKREMVWALAVAALAGALYAATVLPDFGGPDDTPKFQFLGYVLGTAHPPGYPLYVLLTHLFVKLPIGTIAYRANLFSAVMAALACVLVFVLARLIGARRWTSTCAALGMAAGVSFWRSAVFAEVYSLAAFMAALTLTLLLAWGETRRTALLLGAVAAFAAGLGNHLTIIGLAPACLLYVLVRDRRSVTPRVIAGAVVPLAIGLAQYGFIVLRTHQNAPYLESRAASPGDLLAVVTAQHFADQRFAFTFRSLVFEQGPAVVRTMARDLGVAGAVLFTLGVAVALKRRSGNAALLLGGAAGSLAMVLNLSGDVQGFVTPLMVLVWPLCALGADALLPGAGSPRSWRTLTALVAAAAMPLSNVVLHYRAADQRHGDQAGRFFRALHAELPAGAGVVAEDYFSDMALEYFRLTGEAAPGKHIRNVEFDEAAVRDAAWGSRGADVHGPPQPVLAFANAATFLAAKGLRFVPVALPGLPLADWLSELPPGTVLAGATAEVPEPVDLSPIGHGDARPIGRAQTFEAFAAVAQRPGVGWSKGHLAAEVVVDPSTVGAPLPPFGGRLRAVADASSARVELAGRTIARAERGVALGVFTRDGTLMRTLSFPASGGRRVPFEESVYELTGEAPCVELRKDAWQDLTPALTTGSWVATVSGIGSVLVETELRDAAPVTVHATGLLGDAKARDVTMRQTPEGRATWVTEFARTGPARPVFRVALNRPNMRARARLLSSVDDTFRVCAHAPHPLFRDGTASTIRADFESEAYFGEGWSGSERTPTGSVRRAAAHATLLLPLDHDYIYRLSLDLAGAAGGRIEVLVNGTSGGACSADDDGAWCEVIIRPARGISWVTLIGGAPAAGTQPMPLTFRGARIERSAAVR